MSRIGVSRAVVVWSLAIFLAQPAARAQEEKFGEINFPIACSAAAQRQFNRAVAMLHSFFFPETVKAFTALAQQEPSCAMAYWGIAISQRPNPLVAPFPAELMDKAWQAGASESGDWSGRRLWPGIPYEARSSRVIWKR